MSDLDEAVQRSDEAWEELQKTLLELFREYFRIRGQVVYEQTTTQELDAVIKGEG